MLSKGVFHLVKSVQGQLALNLDTAALCLVEPGPLVRYLSNHKKINLATLRVPQDRPTLVMAVKGIRIEVNHRGTARRKYRIVDVSRYPASEEKFEHEGRQVTVVEYFHTKYNITLQYPHLPCVRVGTKGTNLPMECCDISSGQRYMNLLNAKQRSGMVNATCALPVDRQRVIAEAANTNDAEQLLSGYGITVDRQMMKIQARVLPTPRIAVGQQKTEMPVNGVWQSKAPFKQGAPIAKYEIWSLVPLNQQDASQAGKWFQQFLQLLHFKGMQVTQLSLFSPQVMTASQCQKRLEHFAVEWARQPTKRLNIIFILLTSDKDPTYRIIKKLGDTAIGLVTQCLDINKMMDVKKGGMQYQVNVGLKVNAKLGGVNFALQSMVSLSTGQNAPNLPSTIIMGADVHHPPPANQVSPSIAAVVGSYDDSATLYHTVILPQVNRLECIADMKSATSAILLNYYQKNRQQRPQRVIMFRDGVGRDHVRRYSRPRTSCDEGCMRRVS